VTGGGDTVGVRRARQPVALALLRAFGAHRGTLGNRFDT